MVSDSIVRVTAHVIDPEAERVLMVERMMREHLSREQLHLLRDALEAVYMTTGEGTDTSNATYLNMFIHARRVENLSPRSLKYYEMTIRKCLARINKPIRLIDANDIRQCMAWALERGCSPSTANNERRCRYSSF